MIPAARNVVCGPMLSSPHRRLARLTWSLAMLLALVGNLYPVPEGPYGKLPYVYLAYLLAGMLWFFAHGHKAAARAKS